MMKIEWLCPQSECVYFSHMKGNAYCNRYHEFIAPSYHKGFIRVSKCAALMKQPEPLSPIRITRDEMFKQIVQITAQRSSCKRKQVGALIVKNNRIISQGYNGPAAGIDCPICEGPNCSKSVHAEVNAISFAAKQGTSTYGTTIYCTMSPCLNCAKAIVHSGIEKVIYLNEYRDTAGIEFLKTAGIETIYLGDDDN